VELFQTTHWSVVLLAGRRGLGGVTAGAEELCRAYWYPLYSYIRRRGYGVPEAQDLTQEFFARDAFQRLAGPGPSLPAAGFAPFCWPRSTISWRMSGAGRQCQKTRRRKDLHLAAMTPLRGTTRWRRSPRLPRSWLSIGSGL